LRGFGAMLLLVQPGTEESIALLWSYWISFRSWPGVAYSVRYLTAFFARELLADVSVGGAFEGAGAAADVNAGLIEISSK